MYVSSQKSWLKKTIGVTFSCSNSINILYKDVKACKLYSNRTIIFSQFFQKSFHCLTWRSNSMNAKNSRNLWIEFRQKRSEGPEWVEACAFCLVPERKVINFATCLFNPACYFFSGWQIWLCLVEDAWVLYKYGPSPQTSQTSTLQYTVHFQTPECKTWISATWVWVRTPQQMSRQL